VFAAGLRDGSLETMGKRRDLPIRLEADILGSPG
jgi:hypothetical protein